MPKEQRTARFVSAIACVTGDSDCIYVRGECPGYIGFERRGERGFGYDPIFMVGEESFSEMSDAHKDAISHRGIALRKLFDSLKAWKEAGGK